MQLKAQTISYQYTVTEAFDGATFAPSPEPSSARRDDEQFYQLADRELGLFPTNNPQVEMALGPARGNRWIPWIELALDGPAPVGSVIQVVDTTIREGEVRVLKEVASYAGQDQVYVETGFMVPQGASLRVVGGIGVLRYNVTFLDPQALMLIVSLVNNAGGGGGGGDVTDGANVGAPPGTGLVFRDKTGSNLNFRSLVGVNGATISTVGDNVVVDAGGGISPVLSDSFTDDTTLDIPVGAFAVDGQIVVDMSLFDTVSNRNKGLQWVFGVSPTVAAADIVQSNAGLINVTPSAAGVGPNVVCRLQGTGPGNLVQVRYRVLTIPRT